MGVMIRQALHHDLGRVSDAHARINNTDGNACPAASWFCPDNGTLALKNQSQVKRVQLQFAVNLAPDMGRVINLKVTPAGTYILSHACVLIQFYRQSNRYTLIFASLCGGCG